MILVICDETDSSAFWAAGVLEKHGLSPIIITGTELANVTSWTHRVDASGADCEIRFSNGWHFRTSQTKGVLNRLVCVPWQWQGRVGGDDRTYALQEMSAFYLSWLFTLSGAVINKPTPQGLCGNLRHPSAWIALGSAAGLPVRGYRQSARSDTSVNWCDFENTLPDDWVYVLGSSVVGSPRLVNDYRDACLRLAAAAGAELLGISFESDDDGGWRMNGASIVPNLICGGEPLAKALIGAFSP